MLWLGVEGSSIEVLFFTKVRVHKCRIGQIASAGNRTRVTSMATMYSTTRPLMLVGTLDIGGLLSCCARSLCAWLWWWCVYEAMWRGISLSANGLLELMGCSMPFSLRRQVLCGSENQNYRRFFWFSWTSPAAEPKNGVFLIWRTPALFFFPPPPGTCPRY